jgi:hypothetical protein
MFCPSFFSPAVTEEGKKVFFDETELVSRISGPARSRGHAVVSTLQELADRQWRDYRARQPGTCFADPDLPPLGGAYELQDAVAKLRIASGDRLIGYKVGCTGPGTVQQFGMQGPIRGCLFESEIRRHGDTLNFEDFANLAIESEMAVPSHAMTRSRRRLRSSNCITSYSGDQERPSRNSLRTMVSMADLSSRARVGSHRDYTSREEAHCLSALMAVSSHRASYGQYLAVLVLRLSGFGGTWQIFGPMLFPLCRCSSRNRYAACRISCVKT